MVMKVSLIVRPVVCGGQDFYPFCCAYNAVRTDLCVWAGKQGASRNYTAQQQLCCMFQGRQAVSISDGVSSMIAGEGLNLEGAGGRSFSLRERPLLTL